MKRKGKKWTVWKSPPCQTLQLWFPVACTFKRPAVMPRATSEGQRVRRKGLLRLGGSGDIWPAGAPDTHTEDASEDFPFGGTEPHPPRAHPPVTHFLLWAARHTVGPLVEARALAALWAGADDFKSRVWHAEKWFKSELGWLPIRPTPSK